MLNHLQRNLRRKPGHAFRKRTGVFNTKKKGIYSKHKKPGLMPISQKQALLKEGTYEAHQKIKEIEKKGKLFGKWTQFGNFHFDKNLVTKFDIPDLEGFDLKPYVSWHTPSLGWEIRKKMKIINDFKKFDQAYDEADKEIEVEVLE